MSMKTLSRWMLSAFCTWIFFAPPPAHAQSEPSAPSITVYLEPG
jgi:hypothetical protein